MLLMSAHCSRCYFVLVFLAELIRLAYAFKTSVHPTCNSNQGVSGPVVRKVGDVTVLLHGRTVPNTTCIFNPTVTHIKGDLYLWAARAYTPVNPQYACAGDYRISRPSLTHDGWSGKNHLVLAAIRTVGLPDGSFQHELVGHQEVDVPMEDPRLFKDAGGRPLVMMHYPKAGSMTVSSINVTCGNDTQGHTACKLALVGTVMLWYTKRMKVEKNWVPHNGTAHMSYPLYPTFTPHSVFDWLSYQHPPVRSKFDSVAPDEPFFSEIRRVFHGLISFAGSTPAVLHDDGVSYVAVGHMRAHGRCFHDINSGAISSTCAGLASRGSRHDLKFFGVRQGGTSHTHHYKEYGMFFYRFTSKPPYTITHVSYTVVPCTPYHSGITFPAGLERFGPRRDYLITYGEANRYSRLLTISAASVDKLLIPVRDMRAQVSKYGLCTLPCEKAS